MNAYERLCAARKSGRPTARKYIEALCEELKSYSYLAETHKVRTIYIGGGTPSILEPDEITLVMTTVRKLFDVAEDAEISIEVNPGTLTSRKAAEYIANEHRPSVRTEK